MSKRFVPAWSAVPVLPCAASAMVLSDPAHGSAPTALAVLMPAAAATASATEARVRLRGSLRYADRAELIRGNKSKPLGWGAMGSARGLTRSLPASTTTSATAVGVDVSRGKATTVTGEGPSHASGGHHLV